MEMEEGDVTVVDADDVMPNDLLLHSRPVNKWKQKTQAGKCNPISTVQTASKQSTTSSDVSVFNKIKQ
ncbi:hypothetical protein E2C01_052583 [Portunus trituberculatus]|uniref:Uncharacterized protein n=1 Tax=Portunus trituberculatus TaxID=210409 RepID=A0A5B7GLW4_PORTR|nr:hypothetical protein [Portunus trituberculatus]